ncbi:peroxide stress protein YaaA [Fulvivirgaceae bacterium BMA10]|uniref:UPF0246 protein QQ008_13680 n=1 Tax=Splendidivirga corallicola TaxID=3051826 RepID=A0ABT8KNY0_9BACT|nr:peroxide stress protein YaaA [Fulvivirgaceae bacterium BMA10]
MIAVISPAKTLDFESPCIEEHSLPRFGKETLELVNVLRTKTSDDIRALMDVSENIAELNVERYRRFRAKKNPKSAKQSIFAFKGDVYIGLNAEALSEDDINYAQTHLRILSGLYGLLRPLDLIQAYRLEMGTKLAFDDYTTLYNYWSDKIVSAVQRDLKRQGDNILINLASNEYFKAINRNSLKAKVINVEFKDFKDDDHKVISFFAKRARGMMARFIIKNKINTVEGLQAFDYEGYYFDTDSSNERELVFKREIRS